jgi:hypothetical protein
MIYLQVHSMLILLMPWPHLILSIHSFSLSAKLL